MNKTITGIAAALLLFPAASLQAQDTNGCVLSAGILAPHSDARDLTQNPMRGYSFEVGYAFAPEGYGVAFKAYLGHQIMPGKDVKDLTTYDLAANLVGIDLIYKLGGSPLSVFTGPSFHQWQVEQRGATADKANMGDQNWKLGWRLGLSYTITQEWSVSAAFTQTHWRSRDDLDYVQGLNPSRPAYFSIMANFKF